MGGGQMLANAQWLHTNRYIFIWRFPKMGLPPSSHSFSIGIFQPINHPAIGVPPWLKIRAFLFSHPPTWGRLFRPLGPSEVWTCNYQPLKNIYQKIAKGQKVNHENSKPGTLTRPFFYHQKYSPFIQANPHVGCASKLSNNEMSSLHLQSASGMTSNGISVPGISIGY